MPADATPQNILQATSYPHSLGLADFPVRIRIDPNLSAIRVASLAGFVDHPTLAASSPDPSLLRFPVSDLIRIKFTRKAIDNSAIRLDLPDRTLNDKKTGNGGCNSNFTQAML